MMRTARTVLGAVVVGFAVTAGCLSPAHYDDRMAGQGGMTTTTATTGTGGSEEGLPCSPTLPCKEDANPCTTDVCTNGFCKHTRLNTPMGPASTECITIACVDGASSTPTIHPDAACGMGLKCNAIGQCAGCKDVSACPTPPDCQSVFCVDTVCQVEPSPMGEPSKNVANTPNDCKKPVCDGKGGITFALDNTDLPVDDNNPCTDKSCTMAGPMYPPSVKGTMCTSMAHPSARVCDGTGACVECTENGDCLNGTKPSCDTVSSTCISCSDGQQNGAETGLDCGGGLCPSCVGGPCGQDVDCKSNVCAGKVCCNMDCSGACLACDLPGKAGTCTPVPKGLEGVACTGTGKACNGAGACASNVMGKAGTICSTDSACYTGACNGMCRLPNFSPCTESAECVSLYCNPAKACAACLGPADCINSQCAGGRCKVPAGGVCEDDGDCVGGVCNGTTHLCAKDDGKPCANDDDCASHRCNNQQCATCSTLTQATDCKSGKCDAAANGHCLLIAGAPCTATSQCAVGVCIGFPAKCQ